ncbi:alpha-sarcoglycan isoform X1 [Bombyx mori]|uniref:Dystroglycan-type cadherin-like domain-containing protein n=2 Tax=Bombyx mori TaxID=7091 RepID=A0A8R2M8D6_BOMMO|nr:alpha-sarcoglycan isoform X1 [Bombyx mori]XP_037876538.1 alpha-sarcoglycan isoform X1 [Bombyx mori]XP_037876539.1 alpha-sarcoglycan isoform X1 [Bombyx mori]
MANALLCSALLTACVVSAQVHTAVETEMFAIPISPNLFNWTYQEFDQQYRFHASLLGKPELPQWLHYIYSGRHHSGFIFGTPPRGTEGPLTLEVIGLNRQDFETRRVLLTLKVEKKEKMASHEVELKIDNLNVEDLLDAHRMNRLKDILRTKLWTESSQDLYATFLASAIDLGARLPLKPSDGEGLVVRLGSSHPFSSELKRLREEVRPLSKLPSCPRDYKRTTVERLFRDAGLTLDWCRFELLKTYYKPRSTVQLEYMSDTPAGGRPGRASPAPAPWSAPARHSLPTRGYARQLSAVLAAPLALLAVSVAALTALVCFHYAAVNDPESESFFENIFHICIEYKQRRSQKSARAELGRRGTDSSEQPQLADNNSSKSLGASPNNSIARSYSPKSTPNLASNYNRPQPPPYAGALHHRKSTASTRGHTPELLHDPSRTVLEESLKLLNEANIINYEIKDPIVDIADGADDYAPIDANGTGFLSDTTGYLSMKPDTDGIDVPDLGKFGPVGPM